jgi:hypothetical protein
VEAGKIAVIIELADQNAMTKSQSGVAKFVILSLLSSAPSPAARKAVRPTL